MSKCFLFSRFGNVTITPRYHVYKVADIYLVLDNYNMSAHEKRCNLATVQERTTIDEQCFLKMEVQGSGFDTGFYVGEGKNQKLIM